MRFGSISATVCSVFFVAAGAGNLRFRDSRMGFAVSSSRLGTAAPAEYRHNAALGPMPCNAGQYDIH